MSQPSSSPAPSALAQAAALRVAFPEYVVNVRMGRRDTPRFEVVSREGGDPYCLISSDAQEIWQELRGADVTELSGRLVQGVERGWVEGTAAVEHQETGLEGVLQTGRKGSTGVQEGSPAEGGAGNGTGGGPTGALDEAFFELLGQVRRWLDFGSQSPGDVEERPLVGAPSGRSPGRGANGLAA